MASIEADIAELERGGVRFDRLVTICSRYFEKRKGKGSHIIFKTPWAGDPRINLQSAKKPGEAKKYQVQQVLSALKKKQDMDVLSKKDKK